MLLLGLLILASACTNSTSSSTSSPESASTSPEPEAAPLLPANPLIASLETAHQREQFLQHDAIQFDLILRFGGKERVNATFTLATNSGNAKISLRDSTEILVLGDRSYHSPNHSNPARVRWDAFTWPYFFMFPYKLSDPGTQWEIYPDSTLNDRSYLARKLTFSAGTGDAPDDWYIAYANPEKQLIEVAAYIVTAGQSQQDAEKDPHAIEYLNYIDVEGIPIASEWKFWGWRVAEGLTDELGDAELNNIHFVDLPEDYFNLPTSFIES